MINLSSAMHRALSCVGAVFWVMISLLGGCCSPSIVRQSSTAKFAFENAGSVVATKCWPESSWRNNEWTTTRRRIFNDSDDPHPDDSKEFSAWFERREFGDFRSTKWNPKKLGKWEPVAAQNEGLTVWCDASGGWGFDGKVRSLNNSDGPVSWKVQFGHIKDNDINSFVTVASRRGSLVKFGWLNNVGVSSASGDGDAVVKDNYVKINAVRAIMESEFSCEKFQSMLFVYMVIFILFWPLILVGALIIFLVQVLNPFSLFH